MTDEIKPDLEKIRHDKCVPVARTILSEMSTGLLTSSDEHKELALKSLSVMLASDLNVDTEVSYIPQLILRSLSEMNSVFQSSDVVPEDNERYANIGHKILQIVSDANISMDDNKTSEEITKEFEPVKEKFNELFKSENLTKLELAYIKDMIFDNFTSLSNLIQNSIVNATRKAEEKALGIEDMSDLSLKKLDEYLKS